ncbi:hypothetical protein [Nocardia aurantiaca]|uniref:Uncharacterized protein n=1 Tax=Nocardia aurantiaca TaxID=2675850 RepID=A0A6I3KMK7_9NOCA|nr:hypothetical protein [Nocardia aurantiaca]MTE11192.1 hypothetical protein [Nocardia aurantiaca]
MSTPAAGSTSGRERPCAGGEFMFVARSLPALYGDSPSGRRATDSNHFYDMGAKA